MTSKEPEKSPNQEPLASEEHPELFHYTSLNSLKGILESNTLWATHANHLNDSSEMKLLFPKIAAEFAVILKQLFDVGPGRQLEMQEEAEKHGGVEMIAQQDGSMIVNIMKSLTFGDSTSHGMAIPFVTSFATHKERYVCQNGMLSQWRGYGSDEAVALVFDTAQLESFLTSEYDLFEYSNCAIADVVYYKEQLDLPNVFPRLFEAMKGVSGDTVLGLRDDKKSLENLGKLIPELLKAAGRIKHQAFYEERECRIIVGVLHESHAGRAAELGHKKRLKTIRHRPGSFGSIPYIQLFEDLGEALPINRILIGPSKNQAANAESVRELVNGLARGRAIELTESEIPYVSTA